MGTNGLLIGDKAPGLRLGEFLKGEPIAEFAPGSVYVIDLWATWCGPCVNSMPHLTALQAKHPEVTFLGVAVLETSSATVRDFVTAKADEIGFRIALDAPAEPGFGREGWMWRNWACAAYHALVPMTFIIDRAGKLAWLGHPLKLEEPLEAVLAGTWDLAAKAEAHLAKLDATKHRERFFMSDSANLRLSNGDRSSALQIYEEAFARHPELEAQEGDCKLRVLLSHDKAAALAYGRRLIDVVASANYQTLVVSGRYLRAPPKINGLDGTLPADADLARLSVDAYLKAESLLDGETSIDRREYVHRQLALSLLAAGQATEALVRARTARDLIDQDEMDAEEKDRAIQEADALIARCEAEAASSPKAEPAMICDGESCRLAH